MYRRHRCRGSGAAGGVEAAAGRACRCRKRGWEDGGAGMTAEQSADTCAHCGAAVPAGEAACRECGALMARGPDKPASRVGGSGWRWPFVWILLAPLATVPLTLTMLAFRPGGHYCGDLCDNVPLGHALASLWPGIFNLAPFLWLRSSSGRVRGAAVVAGILGALRVAVPALMYYDD